MRVKTLVLIAVLVIATGLLMAQQSQIAWGTAVLAALAIGTFIADFNDPKCIQPMTDEEREQKKLERAGLI